MQWVEGVLKAQVCVCTTVTFHDPESGASDGERVGFMGHAFYHSKNTRQAGRAQFCPRPSQDLGKTENRKRAQG